uniref:Ig-like domain-containing protein n=1 Tax=Esox lucius TaxID=8010 RepID=A0AAY5KLM2_ESOLU
LLNITQVIRLVSQTMVVLRGEGESVTLMCSNISTVVGHVAWFKQVNRSEPVCISTMYSSHSSTVNYYLENRHFEMYSNNTTIFLNITKVEIADSGLYFCGFFTNTNFKIIIALPISKFQGPT